MLKNETIIPTISIKRLIVKNSIEFASFFISITVTLSDIRLSLGRGGPRIAIVDKPTFNNCKNAAIAVVTQNPFIW